ncbi:hypothetical protein H5410_016282 [Solanum commersonii]|uniref:Uncharacterized protein n=1 Tax=Solanum commersonii TaxID=4109 RepID=A0A9J5ZWY1_SOLCO|nr:hypothetical protein H5410_016282 [Solanum commersonii]
MEEIMIKKGAWSPEEDQNLKDYVMRFGIWNWNLMPKFAGLSRTGKSCRLRWVNYLHPDVKRGPFTMQERETVIKMYQQLGNRWAAIAGKLPGRTDNEVKNFFHTHLKKHLGQNNIIDAPVKSRRVRKPKKKSSKAQEKPKLFVDVFETWSNMNTSLMISPMGGSSSISSSSIITFDQNEKIDEPNPMIDMKKTVILESNPAATTTPHHQSSSHSLSRTGKSCRLRWMNYLRPNVKRGPFTMEERETVIKMYQQLGNRWATIAGKLPGRTDNEVKNFFHTHLKKHLGQKNIIDAPVKSRRVRKPKKKAAQEKPQLFVDISKTWSNMNTNLMISPMGIDEPNPMIDMKKTVILESNPAATTTPHHQSSSHSNIDSMDQFVDTTSFWLHLLNDANRIIL